jgi:hypothetical protein
LSCPALPSSIPANTTVTLTATTTDIYSSGWNFNYGQYIAPYTYACQFSASETVNWSGGCHTANGSAWATSVHGRSPSCTYNVTVLNNTLGSCMSEVDLFMGP